MSCGTIMTPLHEPRFDELDETTVLEALRSSWVSTGGPFVDRFERDFAAWVGSKHAISVSNGTVGLQLMLETLAREQDIKKPFEVIVPTLTFIATANAVVHAGGHPIFIDCGNQSLNVNPEDVQHFIQSHYHFNMATSRWHSKVSGLPLLAFMPAHIMGWSGDLDAVSQICQRLSVNLVEDAAESLGSYSHRQRHTGTFGIAGAFSFNGNKVMTTGGGGMIVTDDPAFAKRAKHLSTTAKSEPLRFEHDEVGYNFRLVNILAALGCSQLSKLEKTLERKREIFSQYQCILSGCSSLYVYQEPKGISNNWLVNIVFSDPLRLETTLSCLHEHNIGSRPLWTPNHLQLAYKGYNQPHKDFKNSEFMWRRTLSLPSSPHLTFDEIMRISEIIRSHCE